MEKVVQSVRNVFSSYRAPVFLTVIITVVYFGSLNASWHLDDYAWIIDHSPTHLQTIDWKSLTAVALSGSSSQNRLYRPLPMISFALNWYVGKDSVRGYHLVNIGLHIITAWLLFYAGRLLLSTKKFRSIQECRKQSIALLAAILWAIHPIQTQAVTYIVQRMTVMAGMFYLLAIVCYFSGRLSQYKWSKAIWWVCCAISFLCAVGSKENACLLPFALLLVEYCFFRNGEDASGSKLNKWKLYTAFSVVAITIAAFILGIMEKNPIEYLTHLYSGLPYSPIERLLTESRVVLIYVSQLLYPVPSRFSIDHNLKISSSLISPWSTLLACVVIFSIIAISVKIRRKQPLVSFAILFFFMNHVVESTILPLEPIFEHRNYIPSMFLFLPISVIIHQLLDFAKQKNWLINVIATVIVIMLIVGLGMSTHVRNLAWQTEQSLWTDALRKAPTIARPYANLASINEKQGNYNAAISLYTKALRLEDWHGKHSVASTYNNLGNLYVKLEKFDNADAAYKKSLTLWPEDDLAKYNLAICRQWEHDYLSALNIFAMLLKKDPENQLLIRRKAILIEKMGQRSQALSLTQKVMDMAPNKHENIRQMGCMLSINRYYARADWFLKQLLKVKPTGSDVYFDLIMNSIRWNRKDLINKYVGNLLLRFPLTVVKRSINKAALNINQEYFINPVELRSAVEKYLTKLKNKY